MTKKIQRVLRKLKQADGEELIFRLRRQYRIFSDRYFFLYQKEEKVLPPFPAFSNFFFVNKEIFGEELVIPCDEKTILLSAADQVIDRTILLFGKNYSYPDGIDWHRDPQSSFRWPLIHWSKIRVVDEEVGCDPKFIWELNRHQFLLWPAIAWRLTGKEKYAEVVVTLLLDWIDKNPAEMGVNWVESLELGTRLFIWIWLLELLQDSNLLSHNVMMKIMRSMEQQARHLEHYLSFYTSPNTHLTGEILGLFTYSLFVEQNQAVNRRLAFSRKIMEQEFIKQSGLDGVHKELATTYHRYTLEYAFFYVLLCRRNGLDLSDELLQRLEKMCEFLLFTQRPDATVPVIGDNDGGCALPLSPTDFSSWRVPLALGAVLFKRGDLKKQVGAMPWQLWWLLGGDAERQWHELIEEQICGESRFFKDANYLLWRSNWEKDADYIFLDAGKMGFLSAGHSHADYLSFELALAGTPLLVDPGTSSYHDFSRRNLERGTSWHNTIAVDGKGQVEPAGSFQWSSLPESGRGEIVITPLHEVLVASHDVYDDVAHRRWLLPLQAGVILLVDQLCCTTAHEFMFNFHFATDFSLIAGEDGGVTAQGKETSFFIEPLFFRGKGRIGEGYISPTYGQRKLAPVLTLLEERPKSFFTAVLFSSQEVRRMEKGDAIWFSLATKELVIEKIADNTCKGERLVVRLSSQTENNCTTVEYLFNSRNDCHFPWFEHIAGESV